LHPSQIFSTSALPHSSIFLHRFDRLASAQRAISIMDGTVLPGAAQPLVVKIARVNPGNANGSHGRKQQQQQQRQSQVPQTQSSRRQVQARQLAEMHR
jgi:hypothetical protein